MSRLDKHADPQADGAAARASMHFSDITHPDDMQRSADAVARVAAFSRPAWTVGAR